MSAEEPSNRRKGARVRTPDQAPALAWVWPLALLGALYATPAALVTVTDPTKGLALAAGVLPAAALGLPYESSYEVVDQLQDRRFAWHGAWNFVDLEPSAPAHIFRVEGG